MAATFKIVKNHEWEEWEVRVFEFGIMNKNRSYFTDDKQDAIDTMAVMKKEDHDNQA